MSTATEISRLTTARNKIRDKMIELGLGVSTDKMDTLANEVDSITNRGSVSATVQEGDTYTIPAGYHNGSGTVSGVAGGGNYTLQSKTITPTKSQQSVTPDNGYYGLSDVTVNAIPEAYQNVSGVTATAGEVLSGKVIVAATGETITGIMPNNGAVNKTLDASSNNQTYTVPSGYHSGSGQVKITLESKSATPTKSSQTITPTTGKVLSSVTVNAIPAAYQDVTSVDATAADVLSGKTIVSSNGTEITGSMPNKGATDYVFSSNWDLNLGDPYDFYSAKIDSGYHNGNGEVEIYISQKTATPSTIMQSIHPDEGTLLTLVTVNPIPSAYQNVTSVTASAADVLTGKTIVSSNGSVINGSMANRGAVSSTLDATTGRQSYTIPAGYHNGSGSVGIVLESKTATPSIATQTVNPTSGKVLSSVTINPIPSAYQDVTSVTASAVDILTGKVIVSSTGTQITGTMANRGTVTQTLDATTGKQSYTIPSGYHSGSGTVSITLETKTATPSATSQNITPTNGKVLSKVTVNAIPSNWGNTTGDTAVASQLLAGVIAHTISGGAATQITGTMPNNGAIAGTIDGLTATSYAISSGYTSGGSVSLTSDIETALAAI